jgi:putative phosphoesterase
MFEEGFSMKKIMIASDIHGSAYYCKLMLDCYKKEEADLLVLLGDILYHGPRNDLPRDYAPKEVIAMLNPLADQILAVRGNCDTEVDQMVLDFNVLCEQAHLYVNDEHLVLVHGHKLEGTSMPALRQGDYLICGHTHIPKFEAKSNYTYVNPGSVSIPKEGSCHSYLIFDKGFTFKNLESFEEYSL